MVATCPRLSSEPALQTIAVGVGQLRVSADLSVTLKGASLGSCIALAAYDPGARVGGVVHFMLPSASISPERAAACPALFCDTALPLFFRLLLKLRATPTEVRIFLAGGADVLGSGAPGFQVGARNRRAAEDFLTAADYPVTASDVGGTFNRSLQLNVGNGTVGLWREEACSEFSLAAARA